MFFKIAFLAILHLWREVSIILAMEAFEEEKISSHNALQNLDLESSSLDINLDFSPPSLPNLKSISQKLKNITYLYPEEIVSAYPLRKDILIDDCSKDSPSVIIIVDVFRAFSTACYVLENNPATYMITTKSEVISRLASSVSHPLLIGKPERGSNLTYHIPNSPTRVLSSDIVDHSVLHRTEAGARGILLAQNADIILAASFTNADATVNYIKQLINPRISIAPMGHEASIPSLEDHLCALYIGCLINDKKIDLDSYLPYLREGSGQYFFSEDQYQYPHEDFDLSTAIGHSNFAIKALVKDDYAILVRCE